jgi:hypothetical protein
VSFDSGSNANDERDSRLARPYGESSVREAGSESDFRHLHPEKLSPRIASSSDSDSKTNEDRVEQSEKHPPWRERTFLGIQIDLNEQQLENAEPSI